MDYADLMCGRCPNCRKESFMGISEFVCGRELDEAEEYHRKTGEVFSIASYVVNPFDPICKEEQDRRTSARYNKLIDRLSKVKIKSELLSLAQEFRDLGYWKDALALAKECEERAQKQEAQYYELISQMSIEMRYDELLKIKKHFNEMGDYMDAPILVKECDEKIQQLEKEHKRLNRKENVAIVGYIIFCIGLLALVFRICSPFANIGVFVIIIVPIIVIMSFFLWFIFVLKRNNSKNI